jgi:hypothetical protein
MKNIFTRMKLFISVSALIVVQVSSIYFSKCVDCCSSE